LLFSIERDGIKSFVLLRAEIRCFALRFFQLPVEVIVLADITYFMMMALMNDDGDVE